MIVCGLAVAMAVATADSDGAKLPSIVFIVSDDLVPPLQSPRHANSVASKFNVATIPIIVWCMQCDVQRH